MYVILLVISALYISIFNVFQLINIAVIPHTWFFIFFVVVCFCCCCFPDQASTKHLAVRSQDLCLRHYRLGSQFKGGHSHNQT